MIIVCLRQRAESRRVFFNFQLVIEYSEKSYTPRKIGLCCIGFLARTSFEMTNFFLLFLFMKSLIIFCLCFLYIPICNAQLDSAFSQTDKQVLNKIKDLHQNKIDTIICYYVNCIGSIHFHTPNNCKPYDVKYLIWRDKGLSFMQRFDECNNHEPIEINNQFLNVIQHNYFIIQKEQIKYPEYIFIANGKREINTTLIGHSCHTIFEIYTGNKTLRKDIDAFVLDTKLVDDKYLNRNYTYNQKTILNKLKTTIEAEIKKPK
jgi:hypothetical protein